MQEIAQRVYACITGNVPLMAKITGVYDGIPDNQQPPYILIGTVQVLPGRLYSGEEKAWAVDLHIWSAYKGSKEIWEIADIVSRGMPKDVFFENLMIMQDPSGWRQGILTLRGYYREV